MEKDGPRAEALVDLLYRALMSVYRFERDNIKEFGLGYMEILTLKTLSRISPLRMGEIVETLMIPFSSATRLLGRLEQVGFVERVYVPEDRRGVHVHLTGRGAQMGADIERYNLETITGNMNGFSPERIERIIATANDLAQILRIDGGQGPDKGRAPEEKP